MISERPLTILLVDDHNEVCYSYMKALENNGYCVIGKVNYSEFQKEIEQNNLNFDVAVIDRTNEGNGIDGDELIDFIRFNDKTKNKYIISMSAWDKKSPRANYHFDKTFGKPLKLINHLKTIERK